jgi:hypothetical protein
MPIETDMASAFFNRKSAPIIRFVLATCVFVGSAAFVAGWHLVAERHLKDTRQNDLGQKVLQKPRQPSSVVYDEDGEEMYADDSIEDLERRHLEDQGTRHWVKPLFSSISKSHEDHGQMKFEASGRTGISAKRARKVHFHYRALKPTRRQGRTLRLPLFPDFSPEVEFLAPGLGKANHQIFTGVIKGDPGSRVDLHATHQHISGTILTTSGREFKIVYAGEGYHYVIEVDSSSRR